MDEETLRFIREQAVNFRNRKRKDWIEGKIPKEDFWLIEKMQEMFPND